MRGKIYKAAGVIVVLLVLAAVSYVIISRGRASSLTGKLLSDDALARESALRVLREKGNPKVIKNLIRIIERPEDDQRERGIRALVDIGAPAVEPLITAMVKPHVHVVWSSIIPRRVEQPTGEDHDRRCSAARVLLRLGDMRAAGPMIDLGRYWLDYALRIDPSFEAEMVAGFIRMGEPAVDELFHEYIFWTDMWASQITMRMLVGIGRAGNVATLVKRLDLVETQSAAVIVLAKVGDRRAVPDLVRVLRSQTCLDPYMIAEVLGDLGGEDAESALAAFDRENKTPELALRYRQIIQNGRDEDLSLLVYLLGRYGSLGMAKDYILLGGGHLDVCAWAWAKAHGKEQTLANMIYPPGGTGK